MSVNNTTGNVQILVNPLTSDDLTHYIASQIMWAGPNVSGIAIGLDGYTNSAMSTETSVPITTEQSTV